MTVNTIPQNSAREIYLDFVETSVPANKKSDSMWWFVNWVKNLDGNYPIKWCKTAGKVVLAAPIDFSI